MSSDFLPDVPLVMISTGEYSDYRLSGPYRVLRELSFADAVEEYKAQWTPPESGYPDRPNPDGFEAWLVARGYVESIDSVEVHVGSYGDLELSSESLALRLTPATVRPEARADSAVPSSHVSDRPSVPSDRGSGECVQAPPATTEQAWVHPRRAEFDKFDDGHGPYMEHEVIPLPMTDAAPPLWAEFKEWFARDFGQGYSLACGEGVILDTVTAWAFRAFRAGTRHAAVHHEAPEPNHPKAEGESILREALARLVKASDAIYLDNDEADAMDEFAKAMTAAREVLK